MEVDLYSEDLQVHNGALEVEKIHNAWYNKYKNLNYGAFITFVGIIRDENEIDGLSFDVYEPILKSWFNSWQERAKKQKFAKTNANKLKVAKNQHIPFIIDFCTKTIKESRQFWTPAFPFYSTFSKTLFFLIFSKYFLEFRSLNYGVFNV